MVREVIRRKFRAKGVRLSYGSLFSEEKLRDARSFWETGLRELVRQELPEFDRVVEELKEKLREPV